MPGASLFPDLFGNMSNILTFYLTTGSILVGIGAFMRRSRDHGLDDWDLLLVVGLVGASAIWFFLVLPVALHQPSMTPGR